jgi:pimeloyl-ACP methyl ester carboxylesterase
MVSSSPSLSELPHRDRTRRKPSPSSFLPKPKLALIYLILALITSFGLIYYFRLIRVESVFGIPGKRPLLRRAYERFFISRAALSDIEIPGTLGPVQIRVYTPIGRTNPSPIVLIHGFVIDGNRNPALNELAVRLAGMGFLVALPMVPAERQFEMRPSDLAIIRDTITWTAHKTNQKVTLFAFSFGAGLAIPAAADPPIADEVKLIFCVSVYNNLDTIGRYFIHDRVDDPSGHPYVGNPPGPLMIVSPYLHEMVSAKDATGLETLVNRVTQHPGSSLLENDPAFLKLNPAERKEFVELGNANTPEMRERYRGILERHRAEIASISPSSVLSHLRIPLYILQGASDSVFPPGEIEWIRRERAGIPDTHIHVTPWISHVFADQPATGWQKLQMINFCTEMLYRAAHKVPLTQPAHAA